MRKIKFRGKTVEINENNPSLAPHIRRNRGVDLEHIKVKALVKNDRKVFKDKLKVTNMELAEQEIKEVIKFFNDTLEEGELPREFIQLWIEDEEVAEYEDNKGLIGWLNPKGEFFPCDFGEHVAYARDVLGDRRLDLEVDEIASNQHIPLSLNEESSLSHVGILSDITQEQADWFNRFFDKLSSQQKKIVAHTMREQGYKMHYDFI